MLCEWDEAKEYDVVDNTDNKQIASSQPDTESAAEAECADVCLSNSAPSIPVFSAITVCSRSLSAFSDAISL